MNLSFWPHFLFVCSIKAAIADILMLLEENVDLFDVVQDFLSVEFVEFDSAGVPIYTRENVRIRLAGNEYEKESVLFTFYSYDELKQGKHDD